MSDYTVQFSDAILNTLIFCCILNWLSDRRYPECFNKVIKFRFPLCALYIVVVLIRLVLSSQIQIWLQNMQLVALCNLSYLVIGFFNTQHKQSILFCAYRDLIFIWSKLQLKSNPSKQVFVDQCYQLLRIATNVRVIFPFMKVIKDEVSSVFCLLLYSFPPLCVTSKQK